MSQSRTKQRDQVRKVSCSKAEKNTRDNVWRKGFSVTKSNKQNGKRFSVAKSNKTIGIKYRKGFSVTCFLSHGLLILLGFRPNNSQFEKLELLCIHCASSAYPTEVVG